MARLIFTIPRWTRGLLFRIQASLMFLLAAVAPVAAQQVTGVPGSPSATTTISGKQIPPPPKFGGVIKESAKDSG
jgi:arylsulfatase